MQLRRGQVLFAKYQHRMVDERTVEPNAGRRIDRLAQIDAAHFRAGMRQSASRSCNSASPLSFTPTICAANSAKATRLIANTSIRMLRYGATVSWPSTSWRSDNGTSVAYPRPLRRRRRIGRWLVGVLATTLAAFRAQV